MQTGEIGYFKVSAAVAKEILAALAEQEQERINGIVQPIIESAHNGVEPEE